MFKQCIMFLLAVTNTEIAADFQHPSWEINDYKIDSFTVTVITDNFLSKFSSDENGFSLIESPCLSKNFEEIIFSQIEYKKQSNSFEILKSTISGRPIYYHIDPKGNFFCSTHISMLRKAGVAIEENTDVLPEYFCFGYVMSPATFYKKISQLLAGSQLTIEFEHDKWKIGHIKNYSPPTPPPEMNDDVGDISNTTLNLIHEILRELTPCNDRIAVLLSGGLDSSILFKACDINYKIDTTYSTGYPFEDSDLNNEKTYAFSAANAFHTNHCYHEVTHDEYLRGVIEGISAAEEPLFHMQSVLLFLLFKDGIPKHKNIVIMGQGADGIWGLGLHNDIYRSNKIMFKILSKHPFISLIKIASNVTGRGERFVDFLKSRNVNKDYAISDPGNIIWKKISKEKKEWIFKNFGLSVSDIIKGRSSTLKQCETRSIYDIISIYDFFGDISGTQSIWAKLGESQGKILYFPFNQYKLLNYAYSLPWEIKLKKPKNILREVARRCKIPEFIITRPKLGFILSKKKLVDLGKILEPLERVAKNASDEKQKHIMHSSDPNKMIIYWYVLNYSIWRRLCINNEPVEVLLNELNQNGFPQKSD